MAMPINRTSSVNAAYANSLASLFGQRQMAKTSGKTTDREILEIGNATELTQLIPNFTENNGNYWHSAWESPESFAAYMRNTSPSTAWYSGPYTDNDEFYGGKTFQEAVDMAVNGWPEGSQIIDEVRNHILTLNPMLVKPIAYSVAGAYPNVPRAIAGNPMNMRVPDLAKSRRRPVFTLICNMGALGWVHPDSITNRAACVAAMIDQIEAKGFACEVVTTSIAEGLGDFKVGVSIVVKKSSQAVDIVRLAFSIGHASFFRRLVFAARGQEQFNKNRLGYGLGCTQTISTKGLAEKDVYVLPGINECEQYFRTPELSAKEGLKFLSDSLAEQGCPAFPPFVKEEKIAA